MNVERHFAGSNYLFLDGHVKWMQLDATLNPRHFLWGTRVFSRGSAPIYTSDGVTLVQ